MKTRGIICVVLFLVGCNQTEQPIPPPDLIPQEQFKQILGEVRLLEGAYAARYTKVDTSAFKIESYYERLFQEKGITSSQYRTSFGYYSRDTKLMLSIENDLLNKFTIMQAEQDSLNKMQNLQLLDSLKPTQTP